jgi:hypothetical protein
LLSSEELFKRPEKPSWLRDDDDEPESIDGLYWRPTIKDTDRETFSGRRVPEEQQRDSSPAEPDADSSLFPNSETPRHDRDEINPFQKRDGDCGCGVRNVRLWYCHKCERRYCWECFKGHED